MKTLTGKHVLGLMVLGFGTIIAVNVTLAVQAVRTFPGLEVKNSYVASQSFDRERTAQEALGWSVRAHLSGDQLVLRFEDNGTPVEPVIEQAVFGRATSVVQDQNPEFLFDGEAFSAQVEAGPGNWNLRLVALAEDGTRFRQRVIVETPR